MDAATLLGGSELFRAFSPAELAQIAAKTVRQRCQRGEVLFSAGDAADRLFAVRSGRMAISRRVSGGREPIVAVPGASDLFGEDSLFDGAVRSTTARALQDGELVVVPYGPVAEVLAGRPALLWPVAARLSRQVRAAEAARAEALALDVTGRTARQLLELAGGQDEFALPITQEELAGMVGASRERVNKALAQLARLGWLAVHERRYRILQRDDMERRAH